MAEIVRFDGPNKLIIVNDGELELDAESEVYSAWKRWMLEDVPSSAAPSAAAYNAAFLQALRTVGGDPIGGTQEISPYFFLTNGWRVRPYEGNHRLVTDGNLFVDGGGNPFIPTTGNFNVVVELQTSSKSISDVINVSGGTLLTQQESDALFDLPSEAVIADAVWDETLAFHTSAGTAGEIMQKIKRLAALIPASV
jgi:hypothetical protein